MILDTATRIALTEREHSLDTSVEDYLNELKFGLVEVVHEWANGMVRKPRHIFITEKLTFHRNS